MQQLETTKDVVGEDVSDTVNALFQPCLHGVYMRLLN